MKESMFDVLVYLFENYFSSEEFSYPDQDSLSVKLSAVGFEQEEIDLALDWLSGLETLSSQPYPDQLSESSACRIYAAEEMARIDTEARGFLTFLETSGILDPLHREWVLDRLLALPEEEVSLDRVKWTILIVLWSQGHAKDYLFLEELLFGDSPTQMH